MSVPAFSLGGSTPVARKRIPSGWALPPAGSRRRCATKAACPPGHRADRHRPRPFRPKCSRKQDPVFVPERPRSIASERGIRAIFSSSFSQSVLCFFLLFLFTPCRAVSFAALRPQRRLRGACLGASLALPISPKAPSVPSAPDEYRRSRGKPRWSASPPPKPPAHRPNTAARHPACRTRTACSP